MSALRHPVRVGCAVLTALYVVYYFGNPFLPGANPAAPLGWWGWSDQAFTLESARALIRLNFSPAHHWYPLGYPILGAPFVRWSPAHPFVLVNLGCLLAAFAGFVAFARRASVTSGWATLIFVGTAGSRAAMMQWVVPWNTTPVAALIWLLLATVAGQQAGRHRPGLIGLMAAAIPLCRPTDALVALLCAAVALASRPSRQDAGRMALGGAAVLIPYAGLHVAIYGVHLSPYMTHSAEIGFSLYGLGWKASTLLLDPSAWYLDGVGLLRAAPYLALVPAGMLIAAVQRGPARLLAAAMLVHIVLYVSYIDLLPTGLWRYLNVHYFTWVVPGGGLLAWIAMREILRGRRGAWFPLAPSALAVSAAALCITVVPVPVPATGPARMLFYPGAPPGFDAAYFRPLVVRDDRGPLANIYDIRAFPVPGGMRLVALRRDFAGDVIWEAAPPGWSAAGPPERFAAGFRLGWPCWLLPCRRVPNPLMPPAPLP